METKEIIHYLNVLKTHYSIFQEPIREAIDESIHMFETMELAKEMK